MKKLVSSVSLVCICLAVPLATSAARAEDKLQALSNSEDNWAMQGKNYSSNHYSALTQINAENVKNLKVSWSFSTGLLSGHEGAPLVVDGKMFIHTSFPNNTFALNLDDPTRILCRTSPSRARPLAPSPAATLSIADSPIGQGMALRHRSSSRPCSMATSSR